MMCMEDVAIGRGSPYNETGYSVGTSAVQVAEPSPKRIALIFGSPSAGTITYSTLKGAVAGQGFNISAGQPAMILLIGEVGQAVTAGLFAVADAAARLINVGQSLLLEEP